MNKEERNRGGESMIREAERMIKQLERRYR